MPALTCSTACTYHRLLRVRRRDDGIRVYEAMVYSAVDDSPAGRAQRAAALIDLVVRKYAPLPDAFGFRVVFDEELQRMTQFLKRH